MSTSRIESPDLEQLLKDLRAGKLQLPDFQRGWVWDDEHIRSLLASIAATYPVGAIMMLETGGDAKFQPRPVQGVDFPPDKVPVPEYLILDGQQRLTSLFQATLLGKVVETRNTKKQDIKRWYYVDMRAAANPAVDVEDAIVGLPESRIIAPIGGPVQVDCSTAEGEYGTCHFPLRHLFDYADWHGAFLEHWEYAADKTKLFNAFSQRFLKAFAKYQVPAIVLKKQTPKAAVCQVFEKVNTGGVALNAFELVTATYAAENFSLRDDWYGPKEKPGGRRGKLWHDPVLRGVQETDFLQVVTLLYTYDRREQYEAADGAPDAGPAVSCKRAEILDLPLKGYTAWRDAATTGFLDAAKFLRQQHVYAARDVPYQTQLVPLAATFARLGHKAETAGVRQKLARWFWCGVFGELYGGAVESRFAFDLPDLVAWASGGAEPRTVRESVFDPPRLLTLRTRNSAAYKGVHALLMKDGGQDFISAVPITAATFERMGIDVHHIFPQRWCEMQGLSKSRYDCVVNKTPLSARTNRTIGGSAPSKYLSAVQRRSQLSAAEVDDVLRTHAIEPDFLRADDFETFFDARAGALLERISMAMGKPLAGAGRSAAMVQH